MQYQVVQQCVRVNATDQLEELLDLLTPVPPPVRAELTAATAETAGGDLTFV